MVSMRVGPGSSAGRKSFSHLPQILEVPNLIEVQLNSFRWFQEK
jgi:DNA-directed RNA polymerase beta subunit